MGNGLYYLRARYPIHSQEPSPRKIPTKENLTIGAVATLACLEEADVSLFAINEEFHQTIIEAIFVIIVKR